MIFESVGDDAANSFYTMAYIGLPLFQAKSKFKAQKFRDENKFNLKIQIFVTESYCNPC